MNKVEEIIGGLMGLPPEIKNPVLMLIAILVLAGLFTSWFGRKRFIQLISTPIYASDKFDYPTSVGLSNVVIGLITLPFIVLPLNSIWLAWIHDFWGAPLDQVSELVKSFPSLLVTLLIFRHVFQIPRLLLSPSPACKYIKDGLDTSALINALQVIVVGIGAIALVQEAGQNISLALGLGTGITAAFILAAAPVFSNVVTYFTLLFGQAFVLGDTIEIITGKDERIVGTVKSTGFINTRLDADSNTVIIPNRLFNKSAVSVKTTENNVDEESKDGKSRPPK